LKAATSTLFRATLKKQKSQYVSLVHLGCARNLIDSEVMLGRMAEEGLVITDDTQSAHTVVLNTCSFIGPAREESENAIRELLKKKKRGDVRRVVVAGCLVQRYKHELAERFPEVDLFAEISDYKKLARSVRELADGHDVERYIEGPGLREPDREGARLLSTPRSYAYLRISHGCDHTCSFCAIPSIRGPHRSKDLRDLVSESEELVASGVKELVIVAEDSTAWGPRRRSRAARPRRGAGSRRRREARARHVRLSQPFSVALDPGDARARDGRAPTSTFRCSTSRRRSCARCGARAAAIRCARSSIGCARKCRASRCARRFCSDFPGETDEHAEEVVQFVKEYQLARLGAFTYSPEQGTPGFDLEGRVPADVAKARYDAVMSARDSVLRASQQALVGQELEILVDESHSDADAAVGRTAMDAPEVDMIAIVRGTKARVGDLVRVKVESIDTESNLVCKPTRQR
jgi:ribosomal protein S12 methylthiotransferase